MKCPISFQKKKEQNRTEKLKNKKKKKRAGNGVKWVKVNNEIIILEGQKKEWATLFGNFTNKKYRLNAIIEMVGKMLCFFWYYEAFVW